MLATAVTSGKTELAVPASASVAPGATTATFGANASAVSEGTTAVVVASLNATSQQASLQLVPSPGIAKLLCSPNKVYSDGSSVCTVTLTAAAPNGGTTISLGLKSSAPLTVPASTTVSAESTTSQFSVQAGTISTKQTAEVTATLDGRTASCGVNLAVDTP